jgi:hypothetical protein
MSALWAGIRAGYDRRSAQALVVLAVLYVSVAGIWNEYIDLSLGMDWLLGFIWAAMTALLCWGIDVRRDLTRAAVGFVGGLCIESWGTWSQLWWYWSDERPPLWILPAWPVSALAIDRIARMLAPVVPRPAALWWLLLPPFVAAFTWFAWNTNAHPATQAAFVAMLVVLALPKDRAEDTRLFLGGALLGIFLEYWGTSRGCWTYYSREVPPWEAVVAHGFASVAFARGAWGVDRIWGRVRRGPGAASAAAR